MASPVASLAERIPCRRREPLARWTTLRIGGPAEWFFEPARPEDLLELLDRLHEAGEPFRLLGGGANLLAPDGGVPGAVIHTGAMRRIFREGADGLRVWPGVTLPQLVRTAGELGLSGLERLVGVPGQVGGALAMNAGAADWGIWDRVREAVLWRPGRPPAACSRAEVGPGYRDGNLGDGVVLEALIGLEVSTPAAVKAAAEAILRRKNATQPVTLSSAGCAFRNPPGDSAGRLIDAAGLKGARVGGAVVSERHANFVVNAGGATAANVRDLLRRIEETVAERFGVRLERELVVWPEPGEGG
ncbi:MAG: UDP-N-acetylmuramate dehydrogenase [Planctomycetota bacterium]|nr:MAG: UDP-N-acetylmuramate dehydrogenase [Planctomycetota bacterium]